jgi:hypothetical protein
MGAQVEKSGARLQPNNTGKIDFSAEVVGGISRETIIARRRSYFEGPVRSIAMNLADAFEACCEGRDKHAEAHLELAHNLSIRYKKNHRGTAYKKTLPREDCGYGDPFLDLLEHVKGASITFSLRWPANFSFWVNRALVTGNWLAQRVESAESPAANF